MATTIINLAVAVAAAQTANNNEDTAWAGVDMDALRVAMLPVLAVTGATLDRADATTKAAITVASRTETINPNALSRAKVAADVLARDASATPGWFRALTEGIYYAQYPRRLDDGTRPKGLGIKGVKELLDGVTSVKAATARLAQANAAAAAAAKEGEGKAAAKPKTVEGAKSRAKALAKYIADISEEGNRDAALTAVREVLGI